MSNSEQETGTGTHTFTITMKYSVGDVVFHGWTGADWNYRGLPGPGNRPRIFRVTISSWEMNRDRSIDYCFKDGYPRQHERDLYPSIEAAVAGMLEQYRQAVKEAECYFVEAGEDRYVGDGRKDRY